MGKINVAALKTRTGKLGPESPGTEVSAFMDIINVVALKTWTGKLWSEAPAPEVSAFMDIINVVALKTWTGKLWSEAFVATSSHRDATFLRVANE